MIVGDKSLLTSIPQPFRSPKRCVLIIFVPEIDAPHVRIDDLFLYRFLYACDFDPEAAFKRICRVMKHRKENPDWFSNGDPIRHEYLLRKKIKYVLPKRDKRNRRIFVTKMGKLLSFITLNLS